MTALAGARPLIGLVLRRDRWILPVWILVITSYVASVAAGFASTNPTPQSRQDYVANVASTPSIVALLGKVATPSIGGLTAWRVGAGMAMVLAVIAVVTVVRHTRTEEGVGRQELARSGAVSRLAPLTAVLVVIAAAMLVLGLLIGLSLSVLGLSTAGAFALGLSLAAVGWVFAGLAAIASEICSTSRTAIGLSVAALALAVLLRMAADGADVAGVDQLAWLEWLTPIGWMHQVLPFTGPRWWAFGLFLAATAVAVGGAYALRARRDLGAGLLPERPGPARAGPGLSGPLGLAWRQNRGLLYAVLGGVAVLGLLMGSVAQGSAQAGQISSFLARLGVANYGEALILLLIYLSAEVLAAYAIVSVLRLRTAETDGLASVVLSAPVSRTRWLASQLVVVLLATAAVMLVLGLSIGLAYGLATGNLAGQLPAALGSALAKVPAVWVLAGVCTLLYGLVPRAAASLSWGALGLILVIEAGWELGQVSDALFAVSPYSWVYPTTGQSSIGTTFALAALAALLGAGGLAALRRRDLG